MQNQEKIRTLRVKETYNYLRILEADMIKQAERKKLEKCTLRKPLETKPWNRNLNRINSGWSFLKGTVTILKMNMGWTQTNRE